MTRKLSSAPQLVAALKADGWGDLAGPECRIERVILTEIAELGRATGRAVITAWQLAQRIGYSEKHTRRGLTSLEARRVIRWARGGIRLGAPTPGFIQVSRSRLRQLIDHAAQLKRWATREHRDATRDRITKTVHSESLWSRKGRNAKQNPLSSQPDMTTILPPLQGSGGGHNVGQPAGGHHHESNTMRTNRECVHGVRIGAYCGMCQFELHHRPSADPQSLVAPDKPRSKEDAARGLALVRAALRQAKHGQGYVC